MKQLLFFGLILLFLSCGSSSKTYTIKDRDTTELDALIEKKQFQINSDWAQPQITNGVAQLSNAGLFPPGSNASNVSLIGNHNFFKMEGDQISGYFPYYGERQMGGGYNNNNNHIEFEGIPLEYTLKRGKKDSYEIRFSINDKNITTENYQVTVQVFPNLTSSIRVFSSHRFPIRYKGYAKEITDEEAQ